VQNIPADEFDFRPAEGVRSVAELALTKRINGQVAREFHP